MRTLSAVLLAAFLTSTADAATIIVVDTSGASLQDAIDAAAPGDTILVDGIFAEAIVIDKALTLRGTHGIGSVIPGCGGAAGIDVTADGVRIEKMAVFGGPTANVRIAGRSDVRLRDVQLTADTFSGGCPVASLRGIDVDGSTDVALKAIEAHASPTSGTFGEAFIRLANIPPDGNAKITRSFQNLSSPFGILVEDSDDTLGMPWRGRVGVKVLFNRIVSADVGLALRDSTGVVVQGNDIGGAVVPGGVGVHVDVDSTGNLLRRNRLGFLDEFLVEGSGNCLQKNRIDGVLQPDGCT